MIKSFADAETEKLFSNCYVKAFDEVIKPARLKLKLIDYASRLSDLETPPGNKLEALQVDFSGFYSIRIN